jgi:16S rRNA (cytidine1402-2'-O)-methyltransferase
MLLHEAPHKLRTTLSDLASTLGNDRRISLCRELTKRNEDIMRTTLGGAIDHYENNDPRGEYVLVIEGGAPAQAAAFWQDMTVPEHVEYYMGQGMKKNDAIKAAARDRGVHKNEIYQQVI